MIAIYARQSVDKKDSISIETQIEKCQSEINDSAVTFIDKGFSGKNTNRPEFQRMIDQVKAGKIKKIVVYRIDRFSRSIADFGSIWEILKEHNVEFVSINEKFDTSTPIGRAMLYIVMSFAQLERETIAERIKDNYYARLQNGSWVGGPAPYGFTISKEKSNGKMVSILKQTEEIEIIKKIYQIYSKEDKSLGDIAKHLTNENIPCRNRKAWDNVAVSRILHNPIYAKCNFEMYLYFLTKGIEIKSNIEQFDGNHGGMLVGKRVSGKEKKMNQQYFAIALHQGVIPSDIWLQCNEKLDKNRKIANKGKGKHTWLSGLLKCGNCGYSLKVVFSKEKKYLVCSGRTNYHICNEKITLSVEEIEDEVENEIKKLFSMIQINKNILEELKTQTVESILIIDKKIARLVEAIAESDAIPIEYLNHKIQELQKEKDMILLRKRNKKDEISKQKQYFHFDALKFEEKKKVAHEIIDKIVIKNNNVEVFWRL